jgi:hypothetical protein
VSGTGHRLRLTLLMAGACLPILGAVLIAPVLPMMHDHFAHVPGVDALVPMALTVPALSLALLAPFAGVVVDRLAPNPVLLTIGAVINCLGGGIMLPSLLTLAMSKLEFADRGRGIGLWTGSFFLGQFLCPLVVLALASVVGSTAKSMGVLALSGAVASTALGLAARRHCAGAAPAPVQQIAG